MVVVDAYVMRSGKAFKSLFSSNGGCCSHLSHEVHVSEVGIMVHKNSGSDVAFGCRKTAMNGDESRCGTDELIDAHDGSRRSTLANLFPVLDALITGLAFTSLAIGASRTCGWVDGGEILGYYAASS